MKNYFKKFALLFSISMVFITSCSKEESKTVPVDQIGGIIYQSQVVTVDLPGLVLSNQTYNATIDGIAIQLSKASNEKLTFLVPPSISLGLKDLVIPELNNAVIHYDLKETVLTQTVTETLTPLFDNMAAFTQNSDGSPEALEAEATLSSFTTYFAQASEAEKTELALLYKANKLLFDSILLGTYAGRLAGPNEDCLAIAVIGMGASITLIIAPTVITQLAGLGLFAVSLKEAKRCGRPIYDALVMCENITVNGIEGDNNRLASNSILLQNDVASTTTLNLLKRKLIASDANKTQPVWVLFFSSFNLMNLNTTLANAVIGVLNNLPFVNIAPLSRVQLPNSSANVGVVANATSFSGMQFTVNHPNLQLVSATLQGNGQMNLKVKFVGTPAPLPVDSFLNYSYTDEYTSFSGKLPIQVAAVSFCDDTTTPYPTVTIGGQIWMQKNLNVCKYRNGDDIPQVQDFTAWATLTTGAWCYYENDTANGPIYGKLYNWFAVNDPRGLAPTGYHVPTDSEWTTLTAFLGGQPVAGGKMKSTGTSLWLSPNQDATNSSGFTGLPGGVRYSNSFGRVGENGLWWSSSDWDTASARLHSLYYNYWWSDSYADFKILGLSVRCIKD
ncbi:MAG: hypothetical protein RLZ77_309 [Bacteroidota bacterium]